MAQEPNVWQCLMCSVKGLKTINLERAECHKCGAKAPTLIGTEEKLSGKRRSFDNLVNALSDLYASHGRLESVLALIATPMRPDGTWNRDRAACQVLAQKALDGDGNE